MASQSVIVGLCSRIDYGGDGYRSGLLEIGFKIFAENDSKFVIIAGGLVAGRALEVQAKEFVARNLEEKKAEAKESGETANSTVIRRQLRTEFIKNSAAELSREIPSFEIEAGVPVKIYLITSKPYDKDIGQEVATELIELRPDILYYNKSDERLPTKAVGKTIEVLVPDRAQWSSQYASTAIDRIVRQNQERSAQGFVDVYIVGCTGSYIAKPKGEVPRDYMGLPMISRPTETTTSENQVGVVTLKLSADNEHMCPTNHTLKDLLMDERTFVPKPQSSRSRNQIKIIDHIIRGPITEGYIADSLAIQRPTVVRILRGIMEPDGEWPGLQYDEASRRYDFPSDWFKHTLRYPVVDSNRFKTESIVAFGCLHAGSVNSDYRYFVDELPGFIERECATLLVGAGDFIEGLKHNLVERGEVIAGMNYTEQEKFAARMIAKVLLKVFATRFKGEGIKTSIKMGRAIKKALLDFVYIPGNHDEWEEDLGVTPLAIFHLELESLVVDGITNIARSQSKVRSLNGEITKIVRSKITNIIDKVHKLPSGIKLQVFHPHMGRAATTSLRAEHELAFGRGAHVVVLANFHTAVEVEKWNAELGQRLALQLGTNKHKTKFEQRMGKTVDFGYGCVRANVHNGRIVRNATTFCGSERDPVELNNQDIYEKLQEDLGVV